MTNLSIFSICYREEQACEYEKYFNAISTKEERSYLFEYNCILDIMKKELGEYTGVFSWKFPFKTGIFKKKLEWIVENNPDYDIYIFSRDIFKGNYLKFTERFHPDFKSICHPICKELGIEYKEPSFVVYSNFFIARTEIYRKYVDEVVIPVISLFEGKYKDLVWEDAKYINGLKGEELLKYTGLEFYPYHTFVLERMFSLWIENKGYKIFKYEKV